jgi:hypothetical protein
VWPFRRKPKVQKEPFRCTCPKIDGTLDLCKKYGCPDDPNWRGDRCR